MRSHARATPPSHRARGVHPRRPSTARGRAAAVNVTEAASAATLLTWLIDPHLVDDQGAIEARDAAVRLADAAHERLGTGPTGRDVTERWAHMLTSCSGCESCQPEVGEAQRKESRPS